jgi:hypothetical protein
LGRKIEESMGVWEYGSMGVWEYGSEMDLQFELNYYRMKHMKKILEIEFPYSHTPILPYSHTKKSYAH